MQYETCRKCTGFKICVFMQLYTVNDIHLYESVHDISNNVEYVTSKASDQPAHTRSLIRAFASHLSIL